MKAEDGARPEDGGRRPDEGRRAPEPAGSAGEGPSWGNMGPRHWSRARDGMNREALDYLRERSRAPGVAGGGAERNHYCMSCNGVIPLEYVSSEPAGGPPSHCPHCGVELDRAVRAMFNWVEIDQVPASDLRALLPLLLAAAGLLAAALALAVWWLA